jgi:hypothetical protein
MSRKNVLLSGMAEGVSIKLVGGPYNGRVVENWRGGRECLMYAPWPDVEVSWRTDPEPVVEMPEKLCYRYRYCSAEPPYRFEITRRLS